MLNVIIIIGLIIFGIIVLAASLLTVYAFYSLIRKSISNSKNGVPVTGTIKKVNRIDNRLKKDNSIMDNHIELEVEFEYLGTKYTKILKVYNQLDEGIYKIDTKINCKYNTKTQELIDELNLKDEGSKKLFTAVYFCIIMIVFAVLHSIFNTTILQVLLLISATCFWYSAIFVFYDPYYNKDKDKYIKLKGHVIEYHIRSETDNNNFMWNYYIPEISFKYNHEKKKYLSSRGTTQKRYNIGQEVDVYYNPETDKIYEKGNNSIMIFFMTIPPIVALIALLQYLL
jgi:uncharacterized protein YdcH (DUF465 family)